MPHSSQSKENARLAARASAKVEELLEVCSPYTFRTNVTADELGTPPRRVLTVVANYRT